MRRKKGGYAEICGLGGKVETGEKTYPRPISKRKVGIIPSPRAYIQGLILESRTFSRIIYDVIGR